MSKRLIHLFFCLVFIISYLFFSSTPSLAAPDPCSPSGPHPIGVYWDGNQHQPGIPGFDYYLGVQTNTSLVQDGPPPNCVHTGSGGGPSTPSTPNGCGPGTLNNDCLKNIAIATTNTVASKSLNKEHGDITVAFSVARSISSTDIISINTDSDFEISYGAINYTQVTLSPSEMEIDHVTDSNQNSGGFTYHIRPKIGSTVPANTEISLHLTRIGNPESEGAHPWDMKLLTETKNFNLDISPQDCTWCWLSKIFNSILNIPATLLNVIGDLFAGLVQLALSIFLGLSLLILWLMVKLNEAIMASGQPADTGFKIVLEIANVGLVIAIIIIGFATILHRENYGMRKALPRLLLAAVLINFSFFFAGFFIGLSNELSNVFIKLIWSENGEILGGKFVNNVVGIAQTNWTAYGEGTPLGAVGNLANSLAGIFIRPIFMALFMTLAIFSILAFSIMFLIRYVWLTLLVIALPAVIVLSIFPNVNVGGAGGAWNKWLEKFTNWLIFGPVALFFLWLAFQFAAPTGPNASLITMFVSIALMVAGLQVAQKLGLSGSETAGKMAGWATRRAALYGAKSAALGIKRLRGGKAEPRPAPDYNTEMPSSLSLQQPPSMPVAPGVAEIPSTATMSDSARRLAAEAAARTPEPGTERPSGTRVETVEAPESVEVIDTSPEALRKKTRIEKLKEGIGGFADEFAKELTKEDKNKKKTTPGAFVKESIKGITGIEPSIKGFKHWAEGGDTMKDIIKSGSKELLGDPTHGPFKGIFGHTKSEEKKAKAEKMNKIMKERLAKQDEFLGSMLKLNTDQIKAFQTLKKENAKEFRNLLRPGAGEATEDQVEKFKKLGVTVNIKSLQNVLTAEQHKEFDDNEDVIGIVGRIQDDLRKDELKEQYGVSDSEGGGKAKASTASHTPPASGGGGGGHVH